MQTKTIYACFILALLTGCSDLGGDGEGTRFGGVGKGWSGLTGKQTKNDETAEVPVSATTSGDQATDTDLAKGEDDGALETTSLYERTQIAQGAQNVLATQCDGTNVGGYCNVPYALVVTFPKPFVKAPQILVSAALTSNQAGDVGYATDRVVAYAEQISERSFRMVCSGSPENTGGIYEGWHSLASCSWLAVGEVGNDAASRLDFEGETKVTAGECPHNVGGYCKVPYTKTIKFKKAYETPPRILVSAANISDQGGDVGGATDQIQAYAKDVTAEGFTMVCSGSPVSVVSGIYEGWHSIGTCGWLAVGEVLEGGGALEIASGQRARATLCSGENVGGYCSGPYVADVSFEKEFKAPPFVLASAAIVSDQGGDVGGATDKVLAFATSVATSSFRMACSGSPEGGGPYNGWLTVGSCGWLAIGRR